MAWAAGAAAGTSMTTAETFFDFGFIVFHFDFVDTATGATVLVSERQKAVRDRYTVTVPDPRLEAPR